LAVQAVVVVAAQEQILLQLVPLVVLVVLVLVYLELEALVAQEARLQEILHKQD
jgi:hypothetical protein